MIKGKTDIGLKRSVNQDNFKTVEYFPDAELGVVCDGMGGALGGGEASSTALEAFCDHFDSAVRGQTEEVLHLIPGKRIKRWLIESTDDANEMVYIKSCSEADLKGMGTTLVACFKLKNKLHCINVGDSRIYIILENSIIQVTHDHSYVQFLVDLGKMTKDEARSSINKNIITRAIGSDSTVEVDYFPIDINELDSSPLAVLLCTDGLSNMVSDKEILNVFKNNIGSGFDATTQALIDRANENGGNDNITAVLISLNEEVGK